MIPVSALLDRFNERYNSVLSNPSSPCSSCPSTPPLSARWIELPAIDFHLMTEKHRTQVFDLVIDSFFRDEPLNKCLAFDIPHEPAEFAEFAISEAFHAQCSFVAIDRSTQKVIGVILNTIEHRQLQSNGSNTNHFQSEKVRFILGVLKHAHSNIDLFTELNTDRLMHVVIIAIDATYRGMRLSEKLIVKSLERAKNELHLTGAFVEATSLFSAKAFRKQGFRVYNEIIYANYDGTRLASLAGEHDRCQLLAKIL